MIYSRIVAAVPTIPNEIYRLIRVNDTLLLKEMCDKIILCMNGSLKYEYFLISRNQRYVPQEFKHKEKADKILDDTRFGDLQPKKDDVLILSYRFEDYWDFKITITSRDCKGPLYNDVDFEILNGYGKGIIEKLEGMYELEAFVKGLYTEKEKQKLKLQDVDMYDYDIGDYGIY